VEVALPQVTPRVTGDGVVGLVGVPLRATSMLASQSYSFDVILGAAGYLPFRRRVSLTAQPGFPDSFTPLDLADIPLRREPTVLRGRVVLRGGGVRTPVAGATVRLTGIWRTPPPPNATVPADPPNLIAVHPPLSFSRAAAVGSLRTRPVVPVAGQDKRVLDDVAAGAVALRLSDSVGLGVGDVLIIDATDPDRQEYVPITGVPPSSAPLQPATVTLGTPLALPHGRGAPAQRATPQPAGPSIPLTRDAVMGDTCVFVNSLGGLTTGAVVELLGGPDPAELHVIRLFETLSDGDGYYRLPPLNRVAQLEIEAVDGVNKPAARTLSPAYGVPENRLDLELT